MKIDTLVLNQIISCHGIVWAQRPDPRLHDGRGLIMVHNAEEGRWLGRNKLAKTTYHRIISFADDRLGVKKEGNHVRL
jgi:hypothetical protein